MRQFTLLFTMAVIVGCSPQPDLSVSNAWVRKPPPGMAMSAAYFDVRWSGDSDSVKLIAVKSSVFDRVEIHTTSVQAGVARMRKLDEVILVKDRTTHFAPGGMHLMLKDPDKSLDENSLIDLTLIFVGHEPLTFVAGMSAAAPRED